MLNPLHALFCPRCGELLLDAPACPRCGWGRPAEAGAGERAWSAQLGVAHGRNPLTPAVAAGVWCLPTEAGELIALDAATGERLWARRLDDSAAATALAAARGLLLVGLADTRPIPGGRRALLALDPRSGATVWSAQTEGHSLSAPAIAGGRIFFTSSDGRIHAVGLDGAPLWSRPHPAWGPAAPAVTAGIVAAGGRGETLAAYVAATGVPLWQHLASGWVAGELVAAEGRLFTVAFDGLLSAIDAGSGAVLWTGRGERSKSFTSAPAIVGDELLIGDRVYRAEGGGRARGYALRALDAATGVERRRAPLASPIRFAPLPAPGGEPALLCCDDAGACFALGAADLAERWRHAGDSPPVAAPTVAGELLILADEAGGATALRLHAPLSLPDAAALLAAGDTAGAAAARALTGDLAGAGELYAGLGRHREAAALYERAGLPGRAAPLWAQAGERARAIAAYEAAGEHGAAAALHEKAGDHRAAAEGFRRAGQPERSAAAWAAAGDWERQAADLAAAGLAAQAAAVLRANGRAEAAAALYEGAGELAPALAIRRELQQWAHVAALAARLDLPAEEAAAQERLGDIAAAAASYERAAGRALVAGDAGAEGAEAMLLNAAGLYRRIGRPDSAAACDVQIRRLRRTPRLAAVGSARSHFVEGQWNQIDVELRNEGFGPARAIRVAISGPFESYMPATLDLLPMGELARTVLQVRPQPGEAGEAVPLELEVAYEDDRGQAYASSNVMALRVAPRNEPRLATPPPQLAVFEAHASVGAGRRPLEDLELPLTLQFDAPDPAGVVEIHWRAEDIGEVTSRFRPPFAGDDLALVIRALDHLHSQSGALDGADLRRLAALRLPVDLEAGLVRYELHEAVGRVLYAALVEDREADKALAMVRNAALANSRQAAVHMHFPPLAAELAALPWELIQDEGREPLLLSRGQMIACVRHLNLPQALPQGQPGQRPLRLLAITPTTGIDAELRAEEQRRRRAALAPLIDSGDLIMEEISGVVTRQRLNDRLSQLDGPPDIVHFCGHGAYVEGQGYLLLDREERGAVAIDRVPAHVIARLFREARLVVLYACQSATAGSSGLLTGVAPALSASGVPAVVAMQLSVRVPPALRFVEVLYRELSRGASLHSAVCRGRDVLYTEGEGTEDESWYVPTLTVRTRDPRPIYL